MNDKWWKAAGALVAALLALSVWFAKVELLENREQNKAQWARQAALERCIMEKLASHGERLAHIEGFHEAEKLYKNKPK